MRSTICVATAMLLFLHIETFAQNLTETLGDKQLVSNQTAPWYLEAISAAAQDSQYDGSGVHIYIVGQGTILTTHDELNGRAFNDYVVPGSDGCSDSMTSTASVAAGTSLGSAPNATVHGISIAPCTGVAYTRDALAGFQYILDNAQRPAVVLITLSSLDGDVPFPLEYAVYMLVQSGFPVVVSAGFTAKSECMWWPGRLPDVTAIGAINKRYTLQNRTNTGFCTALFAPGGITAAASTSDNSTSTAAGTALSAGLAAGVAARYLQYNPSASSVDVFNFLQGSALAGVLQLPDDDRSPNALLQYNETYLLEQEVQPPPPSTEPPTTVQMQEIIEEPYEDYGIDDTPELVASCQGFQGQYYMSDQQLPRLEELDGITPNISRVDKWIWFPSGRKCSWDLPWPAVLTSHLAAVFSGWWYVDSAESYVFRVETSPTANATLFIDGTAVCDQVDQPLSPGYHYLQLYFSRTADDASAGLEAYVAPASANESLQWMPLGGGSVVTPNPTTDNGQSCSSDFRGYRSCRCYNCRYTVQSKPCDDFCKPQMINSDILPTCSPSIIIPPDVFKFSDNWMDRGSSKEDLDDNDDSGSVGVYKLVPPAALLDPDFAAKVQNYDRSATSYNLLWWYKWHQCVASSLTTMPAGAPIAPSWNTTSQCPL